jgi:hypothetical protein
MRRSFAVTGLLAAGLLAGSAGAAVAVPVPAAVWELDELGGTVAADSSGNGNHGVASNVTMGLPSPSGTAYGFNGVSSKVEVPTSASLNPGSADFSYTVMARFDTLPPKSGATFDLLRKGLSVTSGGEYKMEIANVRGVARARCIAKDSAGHLARETLRSSSLADGQWHTISCSLSGSTWSVTVDGASDSETVNIQSISNAKPLTIGTKKGGKTGGDWFEGEIAYARVDVG